MYPRYHKQPEAWGTEVMPTFLKEVNERVEEHVNTTCCTVRKYTVVLHE